MAVFVRPTASLARAYAAAKGTLKDTQKVTTEAKIDYLRDHPEVARRMLVDAEVPVGKRGVISAEQFAKAADLI